MNEDNKQCFELLKELGIKPSLKGFDYIIAAVALRKAENIPVQEIYQTLAQKNNETWTAVERAIRTAKRDLLKNKAETKVFNNVFGNIINNRKNGITNGDFIACLSNYLKYEG